jgi:hypothetical protein
MAESPQFARRWYCLTPDGCLLGLLAVEGLLWLFERVHGFGFHPHKGWMFVVTLAIVVAALLMMLAWFVVSLFVGWRFQFSIRSLLVLVVVVAIPCSWFAVEMKAASEQQRAVEEIKKAAGYVQYDYDRQSWRQGGIAQPPAPVWLLNLLGVHFFADVVWVGDFHCQFTDATLKNFKDLTELEELDLSSTKITDAGMKNLEGLTRLRELRLEFTEVTDAGLVHLKGMKQLRELLLFNTHVTNAGVRELRKVLPKCRIIR